MPKHIKTRIAEYVEIVREIRLLKRQLQEFPELDENPTWKVGYRDARIRLLNAERDLRGGDLGKARLLLAQEESHS